MMHYAKLKESPRLQAVMNLLSDFKPHSTFEIQEATRSCAVHSDIAELRANGIHVKREYKGRNENGRQLNYYRLERMAEIMEETNV